MDYQKSFEEKIQKLAEFAKTIGIDVDSVAMTGGWIKGEKEFVMYTDMRLSVTIKG